MMTEQSQKRLIEIETLSKSFAGQKALNQIQLTINPGHIVGLVGPNSSGKSTLLRHLIGMLLPDKGSCRVFGTKASHLSQDQLSRIGYVHQEAELLTWMRCREHIRYVAAHYSSWNPAIESRLIDLFELDLTQKVGTMSPGQRQKLSILLAASFEPDLLILDEPAAALDPLARRQFLELMLEILQDPQKTILISSHILSDIEKVIDHVVFLHQGDILKDCQLDDLREEYVRLELISHQGDLPDQLPFRDMFSREQQGGRALLTLKRPELDHAEIMARLNCQVIQHPLTFEEIYPLILKEARPKAGSYV